MIRNYWETLETELREGTLELETWALKPRSGSFYARAVSDRIFIEGKGIKGIRTIGFQEFSKTCEYYNDYVENVSGIKLKIRNEIGYNTPYILTLIHYVIEKVEIPIVEKMNVKKSNERNKKNR